MQDSPEPNVFGHNGEATDYSTGLQYLRARYYDTGIQTGPGATFNLSHYKHVVSYDFDLD